MSNCTLCPCAILAGCKKSKAEVIILFPATSADVSVRHKWSSTSLAICYTLLLASLYHDRPSLEPTTYAQSSEANQETSIRIGFSEKKNLRLTFDMTICGTAIWVLKSSVRSHAIGELKNLRRTFDKSVVFCARNSVLVKKSTKIFSKNCRQVVLYKL